MTAPSLAERTDHVATPESDREPLPVVAALMAVARCVLSTMRLLSQQLVRQPTDHVGDVLHFADGTSASVHRDGRPSGARRGSGRVGGRVPAALGARQGHALFRAESILNTPLFVGFPGFVSKLWLAHDQHGVYRGVYEWDGSELAHSYARALWWILALVCERGSIHYTVVPGWTRAALLAAAANGAERAPSALTGRFTHTR